ncbi:ABC transporter ATP-binding protein [Thermasporomyces composti]|uniref:ABC-type quaternary amine transporter n=1 Tax=Thermasporomyces composti TaxID=696763 RepID=A0A3D9VAE5_THECX|nr:betaine/proline/choline family ABC transporter ATP-binding protein [Thermasporomyces composti]REF38266.1 osmoprotectant transport system ATP-binding protein [Thermasporomyces composti]
MPDPTSAPFDGSRADGEVSGVPIDLEALTKRYPGQRVPAVENVTMHIPAGEIVVLVGPSGCGKTTTMKMINRLIEPTSGRVLLGGEDVARRDPDELRRGIGYVIQTGGLFPHMTVAQNIGVVPGLLKWSRSRIRERVDELLEMVGLEPAAYRDRYPRELSGGQQQRVGVARALAADPPVLLMDEPFGALDPITRQRLQDELLRLNDELRKTIVFVTHDFDEAVKLGDRIAVLAERSRIVQYDTPEEILANPADDFVASFVGAGAALKQLTITRVGSVELDEAVTATVGEDPATVARRLDEAGRRHCILLDTRGRPLRWVSLRELRSGSAALASADRDPSLEVVTLQSTLNDALDTMLTSSHGVVIVTGRRDVYQGVIRVETIMNAIHSMRSSAESSASSTEQSGGSAP